MIYFLCLLFLLPVAATASIGRDVTVSVDNAAASTTITSPVFTTATGNEQLLAFIAADFLGGANTTVKSVSGGGLTWSLIARANAQSGSSEIWGAFSTARLTGVSITATVSQSVITSMTVMSFSGTNPLGSIGAVASRSAASGAPSTSVLTTGPNSLVLGVGNDFDNAIARTIGPGQLLVHQYLTPTGDTYWMQMQAIPIAASGTVVPISDTAPTSDRFNLAAVELLAAVSGPGAYSVSGTISPLTIGSGAAVVLSGAASATTVADGSGNFTFNGLANGSYTVTPSRGGYTFTPPSQSVVVSGASQTSVNFAAQAAPSWTISGTLSPAAGGAGAAVTLSGASSASTVADANGNYSFAGLANGGYTVTPGKNGYSFSPASQLVTLNGASQTGVNFNSQAGASWSISGTISGPGCNGCSFVQSTHSSQSGHTDWPTLLNVKAGHALVYLGEFTNWAPGATVNMSDSHGNIWHRCDNNATTDFVEVQDQASNGMSCHYTVNIAAWPTITAQPVSSQCVTTNCTQVGGAFFELALPAGSTAGAWATPHAGVSGSGSNNVSCGSIALTEANDFLMCDFNNASGVPAAGTTPVPFNLRENTVTAVETGLYPGSGTITPTGTITPSGVPYTSIAVAFRPAAGGAGATVTLAGASAATSTADANGNYTFSGLANGSYTVAAAKGGYSFTPASQPVTLQNANQTAVNFTAQSASSWSISGMITPAASGASATVILGGTSSGSTVADANGNYTFAGLANGSYSVTPGETGYTFSPSGQTVVLSGANAAGVNFAAQPVATWSIAGTITPTAGGAGASVTLSGSSSASTVADANGNYQFPGLANGGYTITPSKNGYTFTPANKVVTLGGASQTGINFTGQASGGTYSISGVLSPTSSGAGASLTLSGASTATVTADSNGNYLFPALANGTYTVTPSKSGVAFSPPNQTLTLNGANASNINFTGAGVTGGSIARDVTVSQDGASASTSTTSPAVTTSSSNELLLALISTDFLGGTNTIVKSVSGAGLTWTLVKRTNAQSGSSEIWSAFAAVPLTGVTVTANLSQTVISSITVMSFSGINAAGPIGAVGGGSAASGAPSGSLVTTRANSLIVGVGNDFDNATPRTIGPSQILIHQYLPSTGDTYWVQMQAGPVALAGTVATINDTAPTKDRYNLAMVEILAGSGGSAATPPTVSMTSPAQGSTAAGLLTVSAQASDSVAVAGVQFLLDGAPLGVELTTAPYSFVWNSGGAAVGPHTLAARARNGAGLSTLSATVTLNVASTSNTAVVGQWSSVFSLPAVAVDLVLLQKDQVLFYQDGSTATVWNYVQNTFTSAPYSANLFCSGHALLSDGRVLVVGGYGDSSNTIGITNAEIFDPVSKTWTDVPKMQFRRWYPTATTLSDGRIMVTAGWQTSAHTNAGISEIYNPGTNSWTSLTNANNPFETYPFLYLLPDGRVIHIGGSEYPTDTDILDLNTVSWSVIDPTIVDGSSATMYVPNKFMKAGSASDSQDVGPSSNTTFTLDLTQPVPAWKQAPSMVYPRSFMNLTMLPDGSALATGGETDRNGGDISKAVYAAELWSSQTQTWSTMASMHTPREYHGTALLLPDGRVLVSGMGADFGNVPDQTSAEFYSPPYLFKGARPTISQAPTQIGYNSTFFVGTTDSTSVASIALIRTGAVTHFFDQNERFLPLTFTQAAGGLTVATPMDANLAPPGYYMLFLVNAAGVPSIAPFVQLR